MPLNIWKRVVRAKTEIALFCIIELYSSVCEGEHVIGWEA